MNFICVKHDQFINHGWEWTQAQSNQQHQSQTADIPDRDMENKYALII